MTKVTYRIVNLKEVKNDFDFLSSSFVNLEPTNRKAAIVLDQWTQRNFKAEGGLHENQRLKWKPLSPVTIKFRRRGGDKPLQDTGRLKNSFVVSAVNEFGLVQSRVSYANLHEFGGFSSFRGVRVKIPQRKMLPEEDQGFKLVRPVYQKYVNSIVGRV